MSRRTTRTDETQKNRRWRSVGARFGTPNLARWILPGPFHQVPVPGRRGAQRDAARPPRARRTVSIGRHNRHRREPPESRAVSSAGRMVSSLFRSDKSGNPAYILVEKVRDPSPIVLRQQTDGTPLPRRNDALFPSVPAPYRPGFGGSEAAANDQSRPADASVAFASFLGARSASSRAQTRASPVRI